MSVFRPALPVLTVLLSACGQNSVAPEQAAVYSIGAMQLFTQAYADQSGSAGSPAAWAQRHNLQPLTAEAVQKLPAGMMESDVQAVFYFGTAPASCSVKTAVAGEAAARRAFITPVEQGRAGTAARFRSENTTVPPFPFRQLVDTQPDSENGGEILQAADTPPFEYVSPQPALHLVRRPRQTSPVVNL
ncbi:MULTISPECIES: hypothetical protein [unclassified Neisseria]|uniref:NMCC_0638 family (lipo)protein n=1 Tax=unclassified Neisseria TaxID=2623750 RepID=UPI0010729102|nr:MULTISPECIES: hypothetical protein [unclassified Neisseria]MBF0803380.1 hypothetical protein [Neisseria sp. 19428wB4_WF04]TFU43892.1 hypothetical protein E4T99_03260 [Neisseria sp. WF04]